MKTKFIILFVTVVLQMIANYSHAAIKEKACVRYLAKYGWSKMYSVNVAIVKGKDLNSHISNDKFESCSNYAVITWSKDESTFLKIGHENILPHPGEESEDQEGRKWIITKRSVSCSN